MSWTDERVALLTKLWSEGKTAAEIASALGGVTRNAVIGKAHRLKLSNRVSPIQQNKKPTSPPPSAPGKVERKSAPVPIAINNDGKGIKLTELEAQMCRWPYGDPRDENFGFCGGERMAGVPYCEEHAKLAYQAASRNRILKAKEFEEKQAKDSDSGEDEEREVAKAAVRA
ncbi:MAG: hypothetical protein DHS20C02_16650 [Micavibrio sp.]|nr:MAG: hypothetical protein DHS20C02_16650 [Micavibrio sp.]